MEQVHREPDTDSCRQQRNEEGKKELPEQAPHHSRTNW
jgi:hypothetical protein